MHPHLTSRILFGAAILWLAGCQTAPVPPNPPQDRACVITDNAYNHILARHCAAVPPHGANQLLPVYCTRAGMQDFCAMVQNAPNQFRVVQPDGRIRYDANLGIVVGTIGEKCGRMVMQPNGDVVTEFPETANAPMPPACQ